MLTTKRGCGLVSHLAPARSKNLIDRLRGRTRKPGTRPLNHPASASRSPPSTAKFHSRASRLIFEFRHLTSITPPSAGRLWRVHCVHRSSPGSSGRCRDTDSMSECRWLRVTLQTQGLPAREPGRWASCGEWSGLGRGPTGPEPAAAPFVPAPVPPGQISAQLRQGSGTIRQCAHPAQSIEGSHAATTQTSGCPPNAPLGEIRARKHPDRGTDRL